MESFIFNKPQLGEKERIPAMKYKSSMQILPVRFHFKSMKDVREIVPAYGLGVMPQFPEEKTRVEFLRLYSRFAPRPRSLRVLKKEMVTFAKEKCAEVNSSLDKLLKDGDILEHLDALESADIATVALCAMMDRLHICMIHEVGPWVTHDGIKSIGMPRSDIDICSMYLAVMRGGWFILLEQKFENSPPHPKSPVLVPNPEFRHKKKQKQLIQVTVEDVHAALEEGSSALHEALDAPPRKLVLKRKRMRREGRPWQKHCCLCHSKWLVDP